MKKMGQDFVFTLDGVDISRYVMAVDLPSHRDMADMTAGSNATGHSYVYGNLNGEVLLTCHLTHLAGSTGFDYWFEWFFEGEGLTAWDRLYNYFDDTGTHPFVFEPMGPTVGYPKIEGTLKVAKVNVPLHPERALTFTALGKVATQSVGVVT